MVYRTKQDKSLWQSMLAWGLAAALLLNLVPVLSAQEALADDRRDQPAQELSIRNPRRVEDSSMQMQHSGQLVTWDCIWFGSYPQTEVTVEEIPEFNSDEWDDNGDITIEGVKYRRISRDDATYAGFWPQDAGDYRYFRYEPIKWRVLNVDKEKGTAFCLADVGLDCQRYNEKLEDVTWETSTIRSWLNGSSADPNQAQDNDSTKSFINSAFTTAEKAAIIKTNVENNVYLDWYISRGNDTNDYIFLLSESEVYGDSATSYGFASMHGIFDEARRCTATSFAHAMGAYTYALENYGANRSWWWLRSPGDGATLASFVYYSGDVHRKGSYVVNNYVAVRPALNLKLDSSHLTYAGTVASNGEVDEHPYIVSNPIIKEDETMDAGQKVTWDTLWLGSYPQTEVEESEALLVANWNENGDAIVDGVKYRRITREDATNSEGWPERVGTYRYFTYDPIKWRVLSVDYEKGTAFCLADVGLDCQRYNEKFEDVTWETSAIRAWLNGSSEDSNQDQENDSSKKFINRAFSNSEQQAIIKNTINNLPNPGDDASLDDPTNDFIFLLSESEVYGDSATSYGFVSSYGTYDEARRCTATSFAHAMGAWTNPSEEFGVDRCYWWLRSPGNYRGSVAFVSNGGYVSREGYRIDSHDVAVRPAMNVDLSSNVLQYAGTVASNGDVEEQPPTTNLSSAEVSVSDSFTYTGQPHKPEPTVTLDGQTLTPNVDYEWDYENNTDAGTATIIVVGTGENYSGKATGGFTIEPATLSSLTLSTTKYTYDGKAKRPEVRIYAGKDLLVPSEGFELQYKNNVNPGLATVVAKGTGNYTGTIQTNFLISHKDPCFTDVSHKIINGKAEHWFADVVHRAKDLGLVQGKGKDGERYDPYGKITRADITVILWRMSGAPRNFEYTGFKDVKKYMSDGKTLNYYWYAIGWAKLNGVVDGKGEKKEYFAPTDNIKREDFAAILYKYVRNYKNRTKEVGNPAVYKHMKDASKVNGEVGNAVGWCYEKKVMTGSNGYLNPKGTATRVEAAKMILFVYDFLNK